MDLRSLVALFAGIYLANPGHVLGRLNSGTSFLGLLVGLGGLIRRVVPMLGCSATIMLEGSGPQGLGLCKLRHGDSNQRRLTHTDLSH